MIEVGARLDRYEVLALLAQGGMGAVWLARLEGKHGFAKLVALKTILPELAADERFRRMFLDEARIASRIAHPNVAQVLDLGEQDGVLYHVMEWVDGDSLKTLHRAAVGRGEPFPLPVALRVVADACAGLHAAHELRDAEGYSLDVVHRDVSPHNLLVSAAGVAKVTDFGIAKARGRLSGNTTGSVRGKIHYMAPEQAAGKVVDRRADVWALGATLYELCAGRPPFDADNDVAALNMLLTTPPPFLFPDPVPDEVVRVLRQALSRVPAARYPDALALREGIERAIDATGVRAGEAEVAQVVRAHLGDRAAARGAAVQRAIAEADARASAGGSRMISGRAVTVEVPIERALPGAAADEPSLQSPAWAEASAPSVASPARSGASGSTAPTASGDVERASPSSAPAPVDVAPRPSEPSGSSPRSTSPRSAGARAGARWAWAIAAIVAVPAAMLAWVAGRGAHDTPRVEGGSDPAAAARSDGAVVVDAADARPAVAVDAADVTGPGSHRGIAGPSAPAPADAGLIGVRDAAPATSDASRASPGAERPRRAPRAPGSAASSRPRTPDYDLDGI